MASDLAFTLANPHDSVNPFVVITLSNITILTSLNYLQWVRQVQAILEGFDLFKFVDGSHPAPPEKIQSTTTPPTSITNHAYLSWKRQDRLIYGALLPTLSESVASLVTQTTTSAELWTVLKQTFARASRGHIKQLKDRLRSIVKGDSTVTEFMNQVKSFVDLLASIGPPMEKEDVTGHVLRGLDDSFKAVVDGVNARDSPITFDELHEKLLNRELALKTVARLAGPATALAASTQHLQHGHGGGSNQKWAPNPHQNKQSSSTPPGTWAKHGNSRNNGGRKNSCSEFSV